MLLRGEAICPLPCQYFLTLTPMPHIQNVSQESQLVRVMGTKRVLNPGEVAEVTEQEENITKTYKSLFKKVDPLNPYTVEIKEPEVTTPGSPYEAMKQPELKAELEKRGIEIPKGAIKNDTLKAMLAEDDAKKATPEVTTPGSEVKTEEAGEVKTEGSEATGTESTESAPATETQTQSSIAE